VKEVNVLIIAKEKITIRIPIMAFLTIAGFVCHHLNTLKAYLYQAYMMNTAQTTNPSWLKN
jgi:hypothetical protein